MCCIVIRFVLQQWVLVETPDPRWFIETQADDLWSPAVLRNPWMTTTSCRLVPFPKAGYNPPFSLQGHGYQHRQVLAMIRSRLVCLKHVFCALLVLVSLLCTLEVGLRCYSAYCGHTPAGLDDQQGLRTNSWRTHHQLRPLETLIAPNPDTNAPVEVATNSFGLRGPELIVPKPFGVYRVLCLGDDSVLAAEVDESETFCVQLQELLQTRTRLQVEVVNAGVPDFCPLLSFLQFKHSLLSAQADLLVLNFDMSDVADDHRYRRHTRMNDAAVPLACPHPDLDSNRPRPRQFEEEFLLLRWCKQWAASFSGGKTRPENQRDIDTRQGRYAWLKDNPPDWSIYIQQALRPIAHLRGIAERVHARLVVATYPAPWQVSPSASNGDGVREAAGVPNNVVYRSRRPFNLLAAYLQQQGIPFCDTSLVFGSIAQPERLFLRNAPRFSEQGHTLYARELARFLVDNVPGVWTNGSSDPRQRQLTQRVFSSNR